MAKKMLKAKSGDGASTPASLHLQAAWESPPPNSTPETRQNIYTVGGTVQAGSGLYIPRQADEELLNLCRAGEFAYVLSSRQMGKSSLMVRTAEQLAAEDITSVIIDLNQLGVQLTAEAWYLGLLTTIEDHLMLETDGVSWWQAHTHLGLAQRLALFFREVLLTEVTGQAVIFIDEIDSTLSLDFTDDFFAVIRHLYNARATIPEFLRLSFVLIGVATPSDLIDDPKRTPFNIGQQVDLTDFTFKEARPFAQGLGLPRGQALQVLGWALKWTGGHPFLIQRLCQTIAGQPDRDWSETNVDQVVTKTFLGEMSDKDHNLQFVRDMLTKRAPDLAGVLSAYRAIRQELYPVPDEEQSPIMAHLKLSGIVYREKDVLRVRNRIYAEVFDVVWVEEMQQREQVGDPRELARLRALAEEQERRAEAETQRATEQQRRAEAERQRAEEEQRRAAVESQRAVEQEQAAAQLRRRALWLAGAWLLTIIAVIFAVGFGMQAQSNALTAQTAEANAHQRATLAAYARHTAEVGATHESLARGQAVAAQTTSQYQATLEAQARETAEAGAVQEAMARGEAVAAQSTAQIQATLEAQARATAEAGAIQEANARQQAVAAQGTAQIQATLEANAKQTAQAGATQEALARGTAQAESTRSNQAEATAQAEATRAGEARSKAEREAERAREAEDRAEAERAVAEVEATRAIQAERTAKANRATAQYQATQEAVARSTAQFQTTQEAIARSTAEAGATQEAIARATAEAAEATAEAERGRADQIARRSTSRQLALQSLNALR
jgi:flagellar biosynthesis GTPase FlhF